MVDLVTLNSYNFQSKKKPTRQCQSRDFIEISDPENGVSNPNKNNWIERILLFE